MLRALACAALVVVVSGQGCPGSQESCAFPSGCEHVKAIPFPNIDFPYYDQVLLDVYDNKNIDNVCSTAFRIDCNRYFFVRSVVFTDNSSIIVTYIQTTFPEYSGVYRYEGSWNSSDPNECNSCVFNDYIIGKVDDPKCEGAHLFYRCFLYGNCKAQFNGSNVSTGFTSTHALSDYCYDRLMELACTLGYSNLPFIRLPNRLPRRCVADFNGAKPVYFDRIPVEWRVSLP